MPPHTHPPTHIVSQHGSRRDIARDMAGSIIIMMMIITLTSQVGMFWRHINRLKDDEILLIYLIEAIYVTIFAFFSFIYLTEYSLNIREFDVLVLIWILAIHYIVCMVHQVSSSSYSLIIKHLLYRYTNCDAKNMIRYRPLVIIIINII